MNIAGIIGNGREPKGMRQSFRSFVRAFDMAHAYHADRIRHEEISQTERAKEKKPS